MYVGRIKHNLKLRIAEPKVAIRTGIMNNVVDRNYKEKNHGLATSSSLLALKTETQSTRG